MRTRSFRLCTGLPPRGNLGRETVIRKSHETIHCERHDARCLAAQLIAAGRPDYAVIFAHGDAASITTGFGVSDSISLTGNRLSDTHGENAREHTRSLPPWRQVSAFIERHAGRFIMGYVGHEMSHPNIRPHASVTPSLYLFVPECVIQVDATGYREASGRLATASLRRLPGAECLCDKRRWVTADQLDTDPPGDYEEVVRRTLRWISGAPGHRLTVARRVAIGEKVDLVQCLVGDASKHRVSLNYYLELPGLRFAGQSPELLMEGDVSAFRTYKLSGTCRRTSDGDDRLLKSGFRADEKIVRENLSSVQSVKQALESLGSASFTASEVFELPTLLHMLTVFETRPRDTIGIGDCLRAATPAGAHPAAPGLALLGQLEQEPRGPYYGLAGVIRPDGVFCFSQVIRTVFEDELGYYVKVGAAITLDSIPQAEYEETRHKLSGIGVALSQ